MGDERTGEETHSVSSYIALDDFACSGIHGDAARAVDRAIGHNGLGVDARQGRGSTGRLDCLFGHGVQCESRLV